MWPWTRNYWTISTCSKTCRFQSLRRWLCPLVLWWFSEQYGRGGDCRYRLRTIRPGIWGSVLCERKKFYSSSHHHYLRFFLWAYLFLYRDKATAVWPDHSTPSSTDTGKAWCHTSTLACCFMKWCLIKCMDFIFCPLIFFLSFCGFLMASDYFYYYYYCILLPSSCF